MSVFFLAETLLFSNIKSPLSINGEHLAETISSNSEFDNLDSPYKDLGGALTTNQLDDYDAISRY